MWQCQAGVGFYHSEVVVVGNAIMYEICNQVAEDMRCRFRDHKEALYMVPRSVIVGELLGLVLYAGL